MKQINKRVVGVPLPIVKLRIQQYLRPQKKAPKI